MLKDKTVGDPIIESTLTFDLAQEGLLCVLKPWQADVMRFLWDTKEPQTSRDAYDHVQKSEVEGAKSRASVINFLNTMVDEGFLDYIEETGKGGYHRIYSLNELSETEQVFKDAISQRIVDKLKTFKADG